MRYWSTIDKQWQTLIVAAYALAGSQTGQRRGNFLPDEMKKGTVLYYEQVDNRSGKEIYRMHIAEASADRLVIDVENVSTIRYLFVPLFHPGKMQSIYFLDRESENVWRFYSIVRTGKNASRLVTRNEVFHGQPGCCVLSLPGRNSHRPGAASGAIKAGVCSSRSFAQHSLH